MKELINRLRESADHWEREIDTRLEAADALEALSREVAEKDRRIGELSEVRQHTFNIAVDHQRRADEYADDIKRLLATIKYLRGIAERGEIRLMTEEETVEEFVLGYVKRLEAQLAAQKGAQDAAIPAGSVVVPVVATDAMIKAGWDVEELVTPCRTWAAMLEAAPQQGGEGI